MSAIDFRLSSEHKPKNGGRPADKAECLRTGLQQMLINEVQVADKIVYFVIWSAWKG